MQTPDQETSAPRLAVAFLATSLAFCSLSVEAIAGQDGNRVGEQWYDALRASDREAVAALLDPGAILELRDLGISQTGEEFVDSFDEWNDANEGASIIVRPLSGSREEYETCYRFTSNEVLMRESFTHADGRITGSVQEKIADDCGDMR